MEAQIKTITPIHIGSGIELQGNSEYLHFPSEGQIALIDGEKVLKIIDEKYIDQWIAVIEKQENLLDLLKHHKAHLKPLDIAQRIITVNGRVGDKRTMREQLHTGTGRPIVPGTSLKGAIRTATWATLLLQNKQLVESEANLGIRRNERFRYDDTPLSKKLFGLDPNHDIFRLLQVGDATFSKTACYRTEVVNQKGNNWAIKDEITQLIEAIPANEESVIKLSFNQKLSEQPEYFNLNARLLSPKSLLSLINKHTIRLMGEEIDYWSKETTSVIGDYLDHLSEIKSQALQIPEGTGCVMRLGWGTGFRNMTGDWLGLLADDVYDNLVESLRPRKYAGLMFPKSMRLIAGGEPLGYMMMLIV